MRVRELLKAAGGKLLSGDMDRYIDPGSISSDSRTLKRGDFFLPLKGNNFDGEKFIGKALGKGAIGSFITGKSPRYAKPDKIVIKVDDATDALQRIARYHRMKFNIPVIGVTGSNGKTTTKEMIACVLSSKFNVLKNEGTKNNHIGLPQTLLKLDSSHEACVLEMGASHKGEIGALSYIGRPDVAVITNIGPSHLKFFKSEEGVFEAKKELLDSLSGEGLAIINGDDKFLSGIKSGSFKIKTFGLKSGNDFTASRIACDKNILNFYLNGRTKIELNVMGVHNSYNALAAIAVGDHFGLSHKSMARALEGYRPSDMRLNLRNVRGLSIIDDAYNSNPLSMRCALQAIKRYPANARWVVSADMLELGQGEGELHAHIGEEIARLGFEGLLTFGPLSRRTSSRAIECGMNKERVWHCRTRDDAAGILRKVARAGDAVLVKGSRGMRMEAVIEKLKGRK